MGIGWSFTIIALTLLVAPVAGLIWFALDEILTHGGRPRSVPSNISTRPNRESTAARKYVAAPARVDMPLAASPHTIVIRDRSGASVVGRCGGADATGHCPQPLEDGTVPCAGCVLVIPWAIEGSQVWSIPRAYRTCFLGSYDAYRRRSGTSKTLPPR